MPQSDFMEINKKEISVLADMSFFAFHINFKKYFAFLGTSFVI